MVNEKSTGMDELEVRPIPTVSTGKWSDVSEAARTALLPLVIPQLFSKQVQTWTPQRLSADFGNKEVSVVVDLPKTGIPYREKSKDYQRRMRLSDFVLMLDSERSCYLNQAPLGEYPELSAELDIKSLALGKVFALNLWLGNRTRSGLHFDNADNLFGQIYGKKRALLVSPRYSKFLYPFLDNPSKSQVDPDNPDLKHHPKCKRIEVWRCELNPGDALYIPRGWWHHICSDNVSISVNCWHGESLSELEYIQLIFAGGLRVMGRAVYDFLWHGMFGKPYQYRLFSPPPPGLRAYEKLKLKH